MSLLCLVLNDAVEMSVAILIPDPFSWKPMESSLSLELRDLSDPFGVWVFLPLQSPVCFSLVSHILQFFACVIASPEGWQRWARLNGRRALRKHSPSDERYEVSSSDPASSAHSLAPKKTEEEEDEEELEETVQEKKLRLAKLYLEQLRQQGEPWAGQLMARDSAT